MIDIEPYLKRLEELKDYMKHYIGAKILFNKHGMTTAKPMSFNAWQSLSQPLPNE